MWLYANFYLNCEQGIVFDIECFIFYELINVEENIC